MKKFAAIGVGILVLLGLGGLRGAALADDVSVTGSLVDTFCYASMGAHGPSHAQCALHCAQAGIPVGLVEKGSGKMYILLPPKNGEPLPSSVIGKMESEATVTGASYTSGGVSFLTVQSIK